MVSVRPAWRRPRSGARRPAASSLNLRLTWTRRRPQPPSPPPPTSVNSRGAVSRPATSAVKIRVNWSLLIIFWLIVMSLAMVVFPQSVPSQPAWLVWVLAVVAAVLFYASLLAHELAHAIVARRRGVAVEGITLWLFGGIAQLHGEVATPGDEVRITGIATPARSCGILR
jgi:Zn-dependent protease